MKVHRSRLFLHRKFEKWKIDGIVKSHAFGVVNKELMRNHLPRATRDCAASFVIASRATRDSFLRICAPYTPAFAGAGSGAFYFAIWFSTSFYDSIKIDALVKSRKAVTPAQAGVQKDLEFTGFPPARE